MSFECRDKTASYFKFQKHNLLVRALKARQPTINQPTLRKKGGFKTYLAKKVFGQLVLLGWGITVLTPVAYQRCRLQRPFCGYLILG